MAALRLHLTLMLLHAGPFQKPSSYCWQSSCAQVELARHAEALRVSVQPCSSVDLASAIVPLIP